MTYQDYVNFINSHNDFYLWRCVAAAEVDTVIRDEMDMTDDEFSAVCAVVYDWITTTETGVNELCVLIKSLVEDEDLTFQDFINNISKVYDTINRRI